MYLRFNEDGTLAEASPVVYAQDDYTWYDAPENYTTNDIYVLQDGQVRAANAEEQKSVLLTQKKRLVLKQLALMIDEKRMQSVDFYPGKEREYAYKTNLIASATTDCATEGSFGYALLSQEAQARGVSVDDLTRMIKEKSFEAHERLGKLAGFHVAAKEKVEQATSILALEAVYQTLLAELSDIK
ncbi:hypothetical protein [Alteromonas sp. a30]|uniref:hypothetical protein n=1 Tax=Alteromonas sp. a30 TaxID=2730917 RepID=UPI002280890E|nr:hypothetical protein [Alteromonas sp. a30]MCY7294199.1 hypothetical protein [Alteromonas sp. a30]